MARSKRIVESLGTIWASPNDLWENVIVPVLEALDLPKATLSRAHDAQNKLLDMDTGSGSGGLDFDDNGNTIFDDQGHYLKYDAWNRLISVHSSITLSDASRIKGYRYDGEGRIITNRGSPSREYYYNSQWQVIEEFKRTPAYSIMTHYVWSPVYADAMVLRQQNFNSSTSFQIMERAYVLQDVNFNVTGLATWMTLLGDADGSGVVDLADYDAWSAGSGIGGPVSGDLDSDGDRDLADIDIWYTNVSEMHYGTWHVTQRMVYDAYGKFEVLAGEPNPNGTLPYGSLPADWSPHANYLAWRHFHQGLEYSTETGLYVDRFRFYSPTMDRAVTVDPSGMPDGPNRYWMYTDNPIKYRDPSGLESSLDQAPVVDPAVITDLGGVSGGTTVSGGGGTITVVGGTSGGTVAVTGTVGGGIVTSVPRLTVCNL